MNNKTRIQPSRANPGYWQYRGKPTLLLGGSVEDNLYQVPVTEAEAWKSPRVGDGIDHDPAEANLTCQLDTLESIGGNFVRCTMSSRDIGDAWPFEQDAETGLFDLRKPAPEH